MPGYRSPRKRSRTSVKATLGPHGTSVGKSTEESAVYIPCAAAAQAVWILMEPPAQSMGRRLEISSYNDWWSSLASSLQSQRSVQSNNTKGRNKKRESISQYATEIRHGSSGAETP